MADDAPDSNAQSQTRDDAAAYPAGPSSDTLEKNEKNEEREKNREKEAKQRGMRRVCFS
jgi:hypothetical protein